MTLAKEGMEQVPAINGIQLKSEIKEGIARRIHEGKGWGQRVRKGINTDLAIEPLKVTGSLSKTAKKLNIPRNTLRDHFVRVDSYTSEGGEAVTAEKSAPTGRERRALKSFRQ